MKKTLSIVLCLCIMLTGVMLFTGCSNETKTIAEVGTWEVKDVSTAVIEQGKLISYYGNVITLYSDNTFVLTAMHKGLYSSDGGETYTPVADLNAFLYGKYEVTGTDDILNEKTIKITEVNRVVRDDYDSNKEVSDADKEYYLSATSPAVGMEFILGSDHRMTGSVNVTAYMNIGTGEEPYTQY